MSRLGRLGQALSRVLNFGPGGSATLEGEPVVAPGALARSDFASAVPQVQEPPASPIYVRTRRDIATNIRPRLLEPANVTSAQGQAKLGHMRWLGDIYGVIKNADPMLKSARMQRRNGVAKVRSYLKKSGSSRRALKAQAFCSELMRRSGRRLVRKFIACVLEAQFEGGGLIQIKWSAPVAGQPRRWVDFELVPLTRVRYWWDGTMRFATDASQSKEDAIPVEELLPTMCFIPVYVDEDILDFSDRGFYRTVLTDVQARFKVLGDYLEALEAYGNPIPIGKAKTDKGRAVMAKAFEDFGSNGSIVTDLESDVQLIYSEIMKAGNSPYKEAMEVTDHRILMAMLHESQTAQIRQGEGSKASAQTHRGVSKDGVAADWELVGDLGQRFLFAAALEMGLGPGWGEEAPEWIADLTDPTESLLQAQAAQIWQQMGLPITAAWGHAVSGLAEPEPGDEILEPEEAPEPTGPNGEAPADEGSPGEPAAKSATPEAKPPQKKLTALRRRAALRVAAVSSGLPAPPPEDLRSELEAFGGNVGAAVIEAVMAGALRPTEDTVAAGHVLDGLIAGHVTAARSLLESGVFRWLDELGRTADDLDAAHRSLAEYQAALLQADASRLRDERAGVLQFKGAASFDAVIAYWRAKKVLPYAVFDALATAEKALAFSTALNFEVALLEKMNAALEAITVSGGDARDFRDAMRPILSAFGRGDVALIPAYRLNLIFFQETARGYLAGRYSEMFSPEQMAVVDGWLYSAAAETVAEDPEHVCSQLDGLVFRKDDPSSYAFLPQMHFKCRCLAISVKITADTKVTTGDQVAVRGDVGFDGDKLAPLAPVFGKLGG